MMKMKQMLLFIAAGTISMSAWAQSPPTYEDPVPHAVIKKPYADFQNLEELTSRIDNLHRKPFHKLIDKDGVMQPEMIIFKDVQSGHEIVSLTRELCNDMGHGDLGRPVWTVDGSKILFMGNRGLVDHKGEFNKSAWEGKKFIMNGDYSRQRPLIVAYTDDAGNVESRSTGIEGKYNMLDPRDPRYAYYAVNDKLWRVALSDEGDHKAELLCTLATPHRKIIQAMSRDGRLLIQDLNADVDRATKKPQYMPHMHLVDLRKKKDEPGYYDHHAFDYGLPEVRSPDGKVLHDANNNYQFHSLMFGKTPDTIGWNYGPMTSVGEYLGYSLDITNGLQGAPQHGKIGDSAGVNPFGQYESHGRMVGPSTFGLYFSGPATLNGGKKIGEWGLWLRDYSGEKAPTFITPGPGGHVAGGESKNPYIFAAHIQGSTAQWRARVKESDAIMWGDVRDAKAKLLCFTYSDARGGVRKDRASGEVKWSGPFNNDFRPYSSIPRPLLSPDATKVWYHSSMLMPLDSWAGMYVATVRRPEPPKNLTLAPFPSTPAPLLRWEAPEMHNETRCFRVYRSDENSGAFAEVEGSPVMARPWSERGDDAVYTFSDQSAQVGKSYTYAVTTEEWSTLESDVTSNTIVVSGSPLEGKPGEPVKNFDKTAPPAVEGFSASKEADEPRQFRLSWNASSASDVRYYNIYFSSKGQPEVTQKRLIVSPLPGMTSYLDWTAPLEGEAFYAITAVDRQGNESAPAFSNPK